MAKRLTTVTAGNIWPTTKLLASPVICYRDTIALPQMALSTVTLACMATIEWRTAFCIALNVASIAALVALDFEVVFAGWTLPVNDSLAFGVFWVFC